MTCPKAEKLRSEPTEGRVLVQWEEVVMCWKAKTWSWMIEGMEPCWTHVDLAVESVGAAKFPPGWRTRER